jgi:ABC-type Mn2+/Zn2+ transport system permease subunit
VRWITDPFAFTFFGRALLAGVLAGAVLGALGAFVVVRRMAYIAHGLSHAVVGGAAISGAIAVNPLLGAGVWAFLTALLIERVGRLRGLYADTAIGVVTTASFAIGIAVLSAASRWERNLESFLFGSLLGVRPGDLVLLAAVALAVTAALVGRFQPMTFVTFDLRQAQAAHPGPLAAP